MLTCKDLNIYIIRRLGRDTEAETLSIHLTEEEAMVELRKVFQNYLDHGGCWGAHPGSKKMILERYWELHVVNIKAVTERVFVTSTSEESICFYKAFVNSEGENEIIFNDKSTTS